MKVHSLTLAQEMQMNLFLPVVVAKEDCNAEDANPPTSAFRSRVSLDSLGCTQA